MRDGQLVCDVCEQVYPASKTTRFAYEGRLYELDLCAPHVRKLAKVLDQFVKAARPIEDGTLTPEGS